MTTYLIVYGVNVHDRFAAYAYPTRAEARAASLALVPHDPTTPSGRGGGHAYVIENPEDVTFSGTVLTDVYHQISGGSPMNQFAPRAEKVAQLMRALVNMITINPQEHTVETDMTMTTFEHNEEEPARQEFSVPELLQEIDTLKAQLAALSAKPARKPRSHALGEYQPARRNSNLGKIIEAVHPHGKHIDEVAAHIGLTKDAAIALLRRSRVTHGIDHTINDQHTLHMVIPEGAALFKEPKAKPANGERRARGPNTNNNAITEAAKLGVMPEKPVVTSESNKHRQKHFDQLEKYAREGYWTGVREYHMKGVDSYSAMINRYRDNLLLAHDAQAATADAAE